MAELIGIGFVAGLVAAISPCIVPVLPVVLAGGVSEGAGLTSSRTRRRPVAVVAGLVLSFSLLILVGSEILSALHLPQDLLRYAGVGVLVIVGAAYLFPPLGSVVEKPFVRLRVKQPSPETGGFVIGLGLGLVFVPCAGPILAALTVVGATHRVGLTAVFLTLAFGIGAAVPLLMIALAGREVINRVKTLRALGPRLRQLSGLILVVMALAIGFNTFAGLQRDLPGYTSALQSRFEGSAAVRGELGAITGNAGSSLATCDSGTPGLVDCGPAPRFRGMTAWLNTPHGRAVTLASLRGKVVLVDFWTYSCINCQRSLPHVEAWYREYERDGLVVVGVHTPEFAFEHVVSNVRAQAAALGVRYPVAIDNNYATWNAYDNQAWPADYLIDASGDVRHVSVGEGDYGGTEQLIRDLLVEARPGIILPPRTSVADRTPTAQISPETYLGYDRLQYLVPAGSVVRNAPAQYQFPDSLPLGSLALSGTWTDQAQEATAGAMAQAELAFEANDVYLVMGGTGTVQVSVNGVPTETVQVSGVPKLYTLFEARLFTVGQLELQASPGVEAYDFTFG
ncbi:MAG: cytochrome c biogenesis protein DipZ [Acidimicrobiales bacterium]